MGLGGEMEPTFCPNAPLMQTLYLGNQAGRIHHGSAGDQAGDPGTKNAGRDQVQDVLLATNLHGVAGIVAPLGTKNPVRLPGHHIEDFSFPLIPPLEAEYDGDVGFQTGSQTKTSRT